MTSPRTRWLAVAAALLCLDVAVTFENIWPTPAAYWAGGVSVELALCVVASATLVRWSRSPGRLGGWLALLWLALAAGRYVDVTAPALYGRDINLYWDLRFIPDVAAMVVRVAPVWLMVVSAAVVLGVVALLFLALRWAWRVVLEALRRAQERRIVLAAAALVLVLFGIEASGLSPLDARVTTTPVVATYAHQAALVAAALGGSRSIPASPTLASDFAAVHGSDVFLVFVESYGAVAFTPSVSKSLAASRAQLAADIRDTRRDVVSAFVESPTFGGSSWLAHISLLSGVEIKDAQANALLMNQRDGQRDTLVKAFSRGGFRTVALMPGLRQFWPEGSFYGFDQIYGADALAYHGPEFGWFALPDQFSLAKFDELEADRLGTPRFVMFPTISTHFPFSPTPPYQPDWRRMMDLKPYDGPAIVRAYAKQPDWTNFTPGYVDSMAYDYAVLGGYLRQHAARDLVMILIGDHQPPAAVSGEHAPWSVPIHVIASRHGVLDRLQSRGFHPGLDPTPNPIGHMHELAPMILDVFNGTTDAGSKDPAYRR